MLPPAPTPDAAKLPYRPPRQPRRCVVAAPLPPSYNGRRFVSSPPPSFPLLFSLIPTDRHRRVAVNRSAAAIPGQALAPSMPLKPPPPHRSPLLPPASDRGPVVSPIATGQGLSRRIARCPPLSLLKLRCLLPILLDLG
ncbi:hypothetical protein NL676_023841 [Syzygium grande]|nr:hypothetical protein NL676_023841 [Syzygium grande]